MKNLPEKQYLIHRLAELGFGALFLALWVGLILIFWRSWGRLGPAIEVGDVASTLAGGVFLALALYLVQGLFYWPRKQFEPVIFIREINFRSPVVFLPWVRSKYIEVGPALEVLATEEEADLIFRQALARLDNFTLAPRLALLLERRNAVDIILKTLVVKSPRVISRLILVIFWLLEPARLFLGVSGYLFFCFWRAWGDYESWGMRSHEKQNVAWDLAWRAEHLEFHLKGTKPTENSKDTHAINSSNNAQDPKILATILASLRQVYNNPDYGGMVPSIKAPSIYEEPWLKPLYRGGYLDTSAASPTCKVSALYDDRLLGDDPSFFYRPEMGKEVEYATLLATEHHHLASFLKKYGSEYGLLIFEGRPCLSWELAKQLDYMGYTLSQLNRRVAAHHRRCRSYHLLVAYRRGCSWPLALQGWLGWLYFAEQGKYDLRVAAGLLMKNLANNTAHNNLKVANIYHQVWQGIALAGDYLIRAGADGGNSIFGDESNTWPEPGSWLAPEDSSLEQWHKEQPQQHELFLAGLTCLRNHALTVILGLEERLDSWVEASPSPILPSEIPPPPPDYSQVDFNALGGESDELASFGEYLKSPDKELDYSYTLDNSDRLGVGIIKTLLATIIMSLFWWQGQNLGLSKLVIYNGLGREVTVEVVGELVKVKPGGVGQVPVPPAQSILVKARAGDELIEVFTQQLAPVKVREVYNIAGGAPLLLWRTPRQPDEGGRFLGRPRWLVTDAEILFINPGPAQSGWVLSGYGDQSPEDILGSFNRADERLELIEIQAKWADPASPNYKIWQNLLKGTKFPPKLAPRAPPQVSSGGSYEP